MWLEQSVYGESKSEQGGREANSQKALQALKKVWSSSLRETLDGFGREGRGLCLDRLSSDINSRDLFLLHVPHPRMDVSCGSPLCPSILEPRLNNHAPRQTGRAREMELLLLGTGPDHCVHIKLPIKSHRQASG